jgi:hypothetical protein
VTFLQNTDVTKRLLLPGHGEVVLLNPTASKDIDPARNVFLLDSEGRVIWQIEPASLSHGIGGFSDIYCGADNGLMAYSANGIEYRIHSETGRIVKKELIR